MIDQTFSIYNQKLNGWKLSPLGYLCSEVKNRNSSLLEENLLSLSYGRVIRKDIETNEGLLPESFDGYNIIQPGDTVLRLTDLQNDKKSLRTGFVTERGIITSAYTTIRPFEVDAKWLSYTLHSYDIQKVFYSLGSGMRQSMNFDDLKSLAIAVPPMEEQRRMADYLDKHIETLNAILSKRQAQIDLLREESRNLTLDWLSGMATVRNHLLNWESAVGDSGLKAKHIFELRNETNVDAPLASATMFGVFLRDEQENDVWNPENSSDSYKLVEPEDFVIGLRSFQHGFSYSEVRGKVSPAYTVFKMKQEFRNRLEPEYFSLLFQHRTFIDLLEAISVGIRQGKNIPYEAFADLLIPMPDQKTHDGAYRLQQENKSKIRLLQSSLKPFIEYKNSLIASVVTGSLDVLTGRSVA